MKMTIKIFLAFWLFYNLSLKIGPSFRNTTTLKIKVIKNMTITKVALLFSYSVMKKTVEKDSVKFWHRKVTLNVRILLFWTFNSKTTKRPKIFHGCFHSSLALLMLTKVRCLQINSFPGWHFRWNLFTAIKENVYIV